MCSRPVARGCARRDRWLKPCTGNYGARVEDKEAQQKELYQKLIETTEHMVRQSQQVVAALQKQTGQVARRLLTQATEVLPLVEGVIAQTRRRVLEGKKMASDRDLC